MVRVDIQSVLVPLYQLLLKYIHTAWSVDATQADFEPAYRPLTTISHNLENEGLNDGAGSFQSSPTASLCSH